MFTRRNAPELLVGFEATPVAMMMLREAKQVSLGSGDGWKHRKVTRNRSWNVFTGELDYDDAQEFHYLTQRREPGLPDGKAALVEPDWVGKLAGFTLLFEALVLMLAQQMPFAAIARTIGESWHRVHAICRRYVDLASPGPTCRRHG